MAHLIEDAPLKSKGLDLDLEQIQQFFNGLLAQIHHEAANAGIAEALFPQQWTHHEGVYNAMMV
jgi:hypothetical protein